MESLLAALAGVIAVGLAIIALRISPGDLSLRWQTGGDDQILHYALFTSGQDVFPFGTNPQIGFPDGVNLLFSAQFDVSTALVVSILGLFVPNGIVLLNVFYLLTFFSVGVTAYFFLRALRIRPWIAVMFGVLFSIAPYHFIRLAYGHGFLANYWVIPLVGILVLMAAGARTDPFASWVSRSTTSRSRVIRRLLPPMLLGLAIASSGSYYFVFAVIIVGGVWLMSSIVRLVRRDTRSEIVWSLSVPGFLGIFVGIELFLLSRNFGERYAPYFSGRTFGEAELYAGKLSSLLLPWTGSGFAGLAAETQRYTEGSYVLTSTEEPGSSLISSLGIALIFIAVLVLVIGRGKDFEASAVGRLLGDARTRVVSAAFFWTFLFYIVSGLGILVAFYVGPQIRAWVRISVFLVLFGMAFLALVLNAIPRRRGLQIGVGVLIAAVALVDQVGGVYGRFPLGTNDDKEMKSFVAAIDDALPDGCGVVQLPIKSFPDSGKIGALNDYDEALPYLFTSGDDIRWSYGSIGGTYGWDVFSKADTPAEFDEAVDSTGACGIEIDLNGYTDNVDGWKPLVESVTGTISPTVTSSTGRFLFFAVPD